MSDAAKVAAEALEMGFRSMAKLLNSIMEHHGVKVRIPCDPERSGDDIDEAADQLKASLQQLDPIKFRHREVAKVAPWAFGKVHGKRVDGKPEEKDRVDLCCFELGSDLQSYSSWTNRLNSEEWAKWEEKDWEEFIVGPVVKHHERQRAWLAGLVPMMKYPAGDDGYTGPMAQTTIARKFDVDRVTIARWIRNGKLRVIKAGTLGYRVHLEDFDKFKKRNLNP